MKPLAKLRLLVLAVLLTGCGTAGIRLGHDPKPQAPDIETVQSELCEKGEAAAHLYLEEYGIAIGQRKDWIARARRRLVDERAECCAELGCRPPIATAADVALLARLDGDEQSAIAALEVVGVDHESAARRITAAANAAKPGGRR